jgi:hypothetical protein
MASADSETVQGSAEQTGIPGLPALAVETLATPDECPSKRDDRIAAAGIAFISSEELFSFISRRRLASGPKPMTALG